MKFKINSHEKGHNKPIDRTIDLNETVRSNFIRQYSTFLSKLEYTAGECSLKHEKDGADFYKALSKYYSNKSKNCNADPIVLAHAVITPLWGEIMHEAFKYTDPLTYSSLMDTITLLEKRAREVLNEQS